MHPVGHRKKAQGLGVGWGSFGVHNGCAKNGPKMAKALPHEKSAVYNHVRNVPKVHR